MRIAPAVELLRNQSWISRCVLQYPFRHFWTEPVSISWKPWRAQYGNCCVTIGTTDWKLLERERLKIFLLQTLWGFSNLLFSEVTANQLACYGTGPFNCNRTCVLNVSNPCKNQFSLTLHGKSFSSLRKFPSASFQHLFFRFQNIKLMAQLLKDSPLFLDLIPTALDFRL